MPAPHRTAPHRLAPPRTALRRAAPRRTAPYRTTPLSVNLRLSERAVPGEPGLLRRCAGALRARADAQGRVTVRGERDLPGRLHGGERRAHGTSVVSVVNHRLLLRRTRDHATYY